MKDIELRIQKRVEAFTLELTELVKAAARESLDSALGGVSTSSKGGARAGGSRISRVKPARVVREGGKRTAEELEAQSNEIVATIKANPGIRADQIADKLGMATKDLALPIKKLLAGRVISKKGQKRATAYSVARGK